VTAPARRARGERGTALVTATVLMFAFTAGAVILLARDYDDRIATRSTAQAIAFQAARAGAQQVAVETLRGDGAVVIDEQRAVEQATRVAAELLADYGEVGDVTVTVDGDRVTVVVGVVDVIEGGFDGSRRAIVQAEGSARAVSG
jgi:Tfp pilus assembly protein PilX